MIAVKLVDKLSDEIEAKMREGFVQYESSHGINVNYKQFALALADNENNTIGVLNAFTAFAEIYIQDMWIDLKYRGKGYGRKLLEDLENRFKGMGFNNINLVTSAFNAPEFYKKCGFELEFVRKNNKNPKLTKFFFIKYFDDEVQAQGLLAGENL